MPPVNHFDDDLKDLLPETWEILQSGSFHVHPAVSQVTLHGSRGLAKDCRADSDVDLCLKVDSAQLPEGPARDRLLREILETTLSAWKGAIALDLAVAFDSEGCGLACLEKLFYEEGMCRGSGTNCFGLYKTQKGFDGYVTTPVEVKKMYPCLVIWKKG